MARKFETYNGYRIVYNDTGARLLADDGRLANAETFVDLDAAKTWIDSHLDEQRGNRREPHIGTVEDYVAAIRNRGLNKNETAMIAAHARSEDYRMTAAELANAAGWKSANTANLRYGRVGKEVAEQLGLKIDESQDHAFARALGNFDPKTSQWELHPELVEALEQLEIA